LNAKADTQRLFKKTDLRVLQKTRKHSGVLHDGCAWHCRLQAGFMVCLSTALPPIAINKNLSPMAIWFSAKAAFLIRSCAGKMHWSMRSPSNSGWHAAS